MEGSRVSGRASRASPGGWLAAGASRDAAAVVALLGVYAATALIIPVHHPFPIGDSWSFSSSAKELIDHGRLRLNDFQGMNLAAQLLLAWPAGALFGSAPVVLNDFTFALSAVTLSILFLLLRDAGMSRGLSLLAVLTVFSNPIWLAQSVSFETEIPFLFFALLGGLLLLRWDRSAGGRVSYWGAWICFAGAALIRQHGIVFSVAGLGYAAWSRRDRPVPLAPIGLPLVAVAAFYLWLRLGPGLPRAFAWHQGLLLRDLAHPVEFFVRRMVGAVEAVNYLGLFLLPLAPLLAFASRRKEVSRGSRATSLALAFVLGVATVGLLLGSGQVMPYLPNVFSLDAALEPLGISRPFVWIPLGLTLISYASACVTLGPIWTRRQELLGPVPGSRGASPAARRFLLATAGLLLAFSLATGLHFDRYLLVPLPFLMPAILAIAEVSRPRLGASLGLVAASLSLAIVFTDQRIYRFGCEWSAATDLVSRGVAPIQIDGGNAFNGYYSYRELSERFGGSQPNPWPAWVHPTAEYVVRTFELTDPRVAKLDETECKNRWGLSSMQIYRYRRTVFEGPPLATELDAGK